MGVIPKEAHEFVDVARAFQQSRVLLTAMELDVFTNLGQGKQTAIRLAEAASADAGGMGRLLNALVALGYLQKEGNRYANTPASQQYLNQRSPDFIWRVKHASNQWRTWHTLTEAVRKGTSVVIDTGGEEKAERTERFIGAMHDRAQQNARELVAGVGLNDLGKILDVGGGSGAYAMAFIQEGKAQTAVIQDREHVVPLTEKYIAEAGLQAKVSTLAGDYHSVPFGSGYDLVIMSAILHINSVEQNISLIKKGSAALNRGGYLLIQDFIIDDSRISPPHATLFSLNMLVGTERGDTYTEMQYRHWMEGAELTNIIRRDFSSQHNILLGRRE
jgi:ubiquinone/menaquinone biosynthesis C-methylase UbiE